MGKIIILLALIIFLVYAFSYYVVYSLIKPERLKLLSNPKEKLGLDYEDLEFESEGNIIRAWYIPSKENRFSLVYAHGYHENRESPTIDIYKVIEEMRNLGANILCFDFSATGESEGEYVTCGYREKYDLIGAIGYAKERSDAPIFIYGISMGAATTALVTSLSDDIVGAICDSPFSSLKDYLQVNLGVWTRLPKFPFQPLVFRLMEKITGLSMDKVAPIESIKNTKVPVLIIHGRGDRVIPYTESEKLKDINPQRVTLDIIENSGHCKSLERARDRYMEDIGDFIEKTLEDKKK